MNFFVWIGQALAGIFAGFKAARRAQAEGEIAAGKREVEAAERNLAAIREALAAKDVPASLPELPELPEPPKPPKPQPVEQ